MRPLAYICQTHAAKPSKTYPRSGCFRRRRAIYKEMSRVKKQNLPYIAQIDRLEWGSMRSDLARLHAAAYSRGVSRGLAVDPRTCS